MIGKYAERFSQEPDYVYNNANAGTFRAFAIMWKEQEEFEERFSHLYRAMSHTPQSKGVGSGARFK